MGKSFRHAVILISLLLCTFVGFDALALETAKVLPKGVRRLWLIGIHSNAVDARYGGGGQRESVVTGFNKTLTMRDFERSAPNLKTMVNYLNATEKGLGDELHAISNIYNDYSIRKQILIPSFQWGLTERLTVGLRAEVTKRIVRNRIRSISNSNADQVIAQLGDKEAIPANLLSGLETLRTENLTPAFIAYRMYDYKGYARPADFERTDLGDTEVGAKYLLYTDDTFDTALQARIIVPTGKPRPLDNPYDSGSGYGAWGLGLELYQEAKINSIFSLSAAAMGRHYFSDRRARAVPIDDADNLPSLRPEDNQVQQVKRESGKELRSELASIIRIPGELLQFWGAYQFWLKGADRFSGPGNLFYDGLRRETGYRLHMWEAGMRFSTIPLFRRGRFQAPVEIDLAYNATFAGQDYREASYGRLDLKLYF